VEKKRTGIACAGGGIGKGRVNEGGKKKKKGKGAARRKGKGRRGSQKEKSSKSDLVERRSLREKGEGAPGDSTLTGTKQEGKVGKEYDSKQWKKRKREGKGAHGPKKKTPLRGEKKREKREKKGKNFLKNGREGARQ